MSKFALSHKNGKTIFYFLLQEYKHVIFILKLILTYLWIQYITNPQLPQGKSLEFATL